MRHAKDEKEGEGRRRKVKGGEGTIRLWAKKFSVGRRSRVNTIRVKFHEAVIHWLPRVAHGMLFYPRKRSIITIKKSYVRAQGG